MLKSLLKYKIVLLISTCSISACTLFGQKHDYNFLCRNSLNYGGLSIKYNESLDTLEAKQFYNDHTIVACTPFSDENGELLFYSNNINLYNKDGEVIENGHDIFVGDFIPFLNGLNSNNSWGIGQNIITIPISDSLFYMFHKGTEYIAYEFFDLDIIENGQELHSYCNGLYLTKIRLSSSSNLYINEDEKTVLIIDDKLENNQLAFCKHANGLDWWLHQPTVETDDAYKMRVYADGTLGEPKLKYFSEHNGRVRAWSITKTSPNGKILARFIGVSGNDLMHKLELFHFDRCSGETERFFVDSLEQASVNSLGKDIEFSESGRFLYITNSENILQLDLQEENFFLNRDTIAVWDEFVLNSQPALYDDMWRLPNGKIVVNTYFDLPYYHVINNPNEKGLASDFEVRSFMTPIDTQTPNSHLNVEMSPNFPEYRMEALDIECLSNSDNIIENELQVVVYPNPVNDVLNIDLKNNSSEVLIEILSCTGEILLSKLSTLSTISFSLENYPAGIYCVLINSNSFGIRHCLKFVKL